jgi:hypothetical protein
MIASSMAGLLGGVGLGVVIGLIGGSTTGVGFLAAPLVVPVFGALGWLGGAIIGLLTGVVSSLIDDRLEKTLVKKDETAEPLAVCPRNLGVRPGNLAVRPETAQKTRIRWANARHLRASSSQSFFHQKVPLPNEKTPLTEKQQASPLI